jgi:hypothetical protein
MNAARTFDALLCGHIALVHVASIAYQWSLCTSLSVFIVGNGIMYSRVKAKGQFSPRSSMFCTERRCSAMLEIKHMRTGLDVLTEVCTQHRCSAMLKAHSQVT